MTDYANMLRQAAAEMRHYGHDGWPNACDWGADEIERLRGEVAFQQARIDALMLEFCPEDMTPEQNAEWERHQVSVSLGCSPAQPSLFLPGDDWHEDDGPVLWWKLPVCEPPYVGTPLDDDWPKYHTHWTRITVPTDGAT